MSLTVFAFERLFALTFIPCSGSLCSPHYSQSIKLQPHKEEMVGLGALWHNRNFGDACLNTINFDQIIQDDFHLVLSRFCVLRHIRKLSESFGSKFPKI